MKDKLMFILALCLSLSVYAQTTDVNGTVVDDTGMPIPGANVIVKNTTTGTVTDFDGNFTLSGIDVGAVLSISYIGYITKEITVQNSDAITVQLDPDVAQLSEVVVVGYGTQKKKEVTGAVAVLDTEAIEKLNPTRVEQALQGQIAGVNIASNSGSPGAGSNIRIRGITTNGDNQPLILVDGNVISDLSVLNPNDIKSINVLKDATAGIYGVRGANGVIIITTKTGRKGSELKFTLDAFTGFQSTSKEIDLLGPLDFAIYVNDAFDETRYFVYPQEGTDWQDEVFQTASISDINLSASGGGEKSAYSFGISNLDQDGIVGGGKSNFRRTTARLSYNYDILENLKLTTTGLYTNSKKNNLPEGGIGTPLYNAVNINPDLPVYDENGDFSLAESVSSIEIINPVAQITNNHNITRVDRYSATIGLDYTFLENFTVSSKFQINYANVLDDVFRPVVDFGNGGSKSNSRTENEVQDFNAIFTDYTWDSYITYNNTFAEDHNLTVLLGASAFRTRGHYYGNTGFNLANGSNSVSDAFVDGWVGDRVDGRIVPRFDEAALASGADFFDSRLQSFFTRVQYNYKGKYLLSAVLRRDGSSNFGPNNKFGYFPSGSIGWNISDEDFWNQDGIINSLKLRTSYGIIGNDRIGSFGFITRLNGEATIAPGNATTLDDLIFGIASGVPGNPDLKWEEQESTNVGLDARLFNSKVRFSADAYRKRTKDLLFAPQASGVINPSLNPSSFPLVNAGTVENKGLEFSISYNDNFSDDFEFNIGFNLTTLDNEVVSVNGEIPPVGGEFGVGISQTGISRMVPGLPLGHFYGYKTNGVYQTQAELDALNATAPSGVYHSDNGGAQVGDLIFVDLNGDGEITPDDRTVIGDPIAELTMGFNIGFTYKNIDFSANAFASIGNDMIRDYERKDPTGNIGDYILHRWQGTGTSNSVPRVTSGGSINTNLLSDFFVEDASFVRLQNAQLGYTVNQDVLESLGIDRLRIYVSGNNLFTITDYKGFDPSAASNEPIGNGIDKGFYPVAKSYLLGVNLKF
ncbi:TonB-dependent receptor [Seonamhaeicola sp.]|uniref:SusC/RagA family TonB-linked outer membrane protein n=1 Tax=Seonamhaeicola sp. TaxID=1912245 RepID=UPI002633B9AB|nr:TonB-dependent receptor [Seonamhaeicola sp.]